MKPVVAACAFLLASSAFAADLTVFGFELGKPLNLPECRYKMSGTMKLYDILSDTTCTEEAILINTYGQPVRRIIFSQKEAPTIVKSWQMIALEADGNLIGVEFFTVGASAQDVTLQTLTQKYGKPSGKSSKTVGNNFGASMEAITASWKTQELNVYFEGITDRLDRGHVLIDLPQASALRESWFKQGTAGNRAL